MFRNFILVIVLICFSFSSEAQKYYSKEYFNDGAIKAEGWILNNTKTAFWKLYHKNGKIAAKGHFINNKKTGYWYFYSDKEQLLKEGHFLNGNADNWWIIYEIATDKKHKAQFKNNQKNGYCLKYYKNKLIKVETFEADIKTGEWTSITAFKRDNPTFSFN